MSTMAALQLAQRQTAPPRGAVMQPTRSATVREFAAKLRITAAALGCASQKDLCAQFHGVNPGTTFDLERSYKWMQGRALPRSARLYDDWALVLGTERPAAYLQSCTLDEFLDLACDRFGLSREALVARAGLEVAHRPGIAVGESKPAEHSPINSLPGRNLVGEYACYSHSWSPYFEDKVIRGSLEIKPTADDTVLAATYGEAHAFGAVQLRGRVSIVGRAVYIDLSDATARFRLTMCLSLPGTLSNVLVGVMSGATFVDADPAPAATRIAMIRVPEAGTSMLEQSNRYLDTTAIPLSSDLIALGVPVMAVAELDELFGEFLAADRPSSYIRVAAADYSRLTLAIDRLFIEGGLAPISEPVRVHTVNWGKASGVLSKKPGLPLSDKPSIAVLPFQNTSDDPEQEYFADGMVEEIITALSRFRQLFVIARNSSFTYKGRAVDVKQVGRELGVHYVLEGSVRKANSQIRSAGQLIDAATGVHLWADRFDGGLENIFDLQDRVTARVVAAIAPKLEQAEIERAKQKPTGSLDAYDHFLRGMAGFHQWSKEGNDQGLQHFYKAIELDSNYAAAYGMAARMYVQQNAGGWLRDRAYDVAETERLALRAAELGHDDAVALAYAGWALVFLLGQFEDGDAMIDRAISLNPNLAWLWLSSSWVKTSLGEPEIALQRIEQALRLSPNDPQTASFHAAKAFAQFFAGRFADAYSSAEAAIRRQPAFLYYLCIAAVSASLAGRIDDARRMVTRVLQIIPELRISDVSVIAPLRRPEDTARLVDGLKKAGLPE